MAKLTAKRAESLLVAFAAALPGAWEDHPWGHTAVKVGRKVFVIFGGEAGNRGELAVTVKLPISAEMALMLPYVERAGYGLGKAGWVQLRQKSGEDIDLETIKPWIVQSYKAIAPRKLSKTLDQQEAAP